jgi:glyoxylase-like metal-dependent hydrolase (beta-lactamase superfamily II)
MSEFYGRRYDLGDCWVTPLRAGTLRLDGGAMFGLVPKALWGRTCPTDELNRITLACNALLVEWPTGGRRVLVEAGHGSKYSAKDQRLLAIDPAQWVLPALRAIGVDAVSITDVVLTHLHFDHAGGLTFVERGNVRATFPHARVHVQRQEYADARANFGVMTGSYREENFAPLDADGLWSFSAGEHEILPGVRTWLAPGHTRGHQVVVIAGRTQRVMYAGDVLPTRHHCGAAYNMGYDLYPVANRESKQRLLAELAESGGWLALAHDPEMPLARVRSADDWFALEAVTAVE